MQQKTQRSVQFEITEPTREAVGAWISHAGLSPDSGLFPSRLHGSTHLSTRQYARIVDSWVRQLGLDDASYGTHTLRRTKATLIYRRSASAGADRPTGGTQGREMAAGFRTLNACGTIRIV
jgi:integrase